MHSKTSVWVSVFLIAAAFALASLVSMANDKATWVLQSNSNGNRIVHTKGLDGEGQLITLADSGVNVNHESFADSNRPFDCNDPNASVGSLHRKVQGYLNPSGYGCMGNHGTHNAGIIAGDAPTYGQWNGMDGHAYKARLFLINLGVGEINPGNLITTVYGPSYAAGSRIISDGFGSTNIEGGDYTQSAEDTDQFAWDNKDYLIVIGAGNEGPPEQYSSIRQEAQAKNVITVGSTMNGTDADEAGDGTSWGPAADGRIKPTLMSPGDTICSSSTSGGSCLSGSSGYSPVQGTSHAHPSVSGSAALVRQYFLEGWYPSGQEGGSPSLSPTAALLKAVLINGATEMLGNSAYEDFEFPIYPNPIQGFGRIHLDNSLYFNGDQRKLVVCQVNNGFSTGGVYKKTTVSVTGSTQPLKATLVWTDYPGDSSTPSAVQLVNDLDLNVSHTTSGTYWGNNFTGGAYGESFPSGGPDSLNVEEHFLKYSPATGTWTIRVDASVVDVGPQPFAVAITGQVTSPPGQATSDHQTGPGQIFQNNYTKTKVSDNVYEVLKETSGGLSHVWKFDSVPCGASVLHLEGLRPANSDGDNFQFYYSVDGTNFTAISGALINKTFEIVGGTDHSFGPVEMGPVYIKVMDTAGGSSNDQVKIDHLEIR